MKAVVYNGTPLPVVEERATPEPKPGQALLRVLRAGICGTDLSIVGGKHPRAQAGLVMGHEIAATVQESRDSGASLRPGELVTVEPIISCGTCVACRTGAPHVCRDLKLYGIDEPGGMAEYLAVDIDRIHRAPAGLPPDLLVLTEPIAVAVHAVRISHMRFGDFVCVIGGGPIGLLVAMVARENGASSLLVSEPNGARRGVAERLGFDVIDPASDSLAKRVAHGTEGADVVFEAAGSQPAVSAATEVLRPRGRLVQVAIPKVPREVSLVDIAFKELSVQGVRVYETFDFARAMSLLSAHQHEFRQFLSEPFTLDQAPEAFEAAGAGDKGMRVVFQVGN